MSIQGILQPSYNVKINEMYEYDFIGNCMYHNKYAYILFSPSAQDTNWYYLGWWGGKGLLCFVVTYMSLKLENT